MIDAQVSRKKVIIFGNSASGKSSLAKHLALKHQLAHLDLDTVAWLDELPPKRCSLSESLAKIKQFIAAHEQWLIEGCYSDIIEQLLGECIEMIFLDLPVEQCVANAKSRPWEPHKYKTKAEQDDNLSMLIDWIEQYDSRADVFSKSAHERLYQNFNGKKQRITQNQCF